MTPEKQARLKEALINDTRPIAAIFKDFGLDPQGRPFRAPGAWMIYYDDHGPRLESIHTDVEAAIRIVATRGYGKVGWLPYSVTLDDAVKAWESQEPLQILATDETSPHIQWRDSVLPTFESAKQVWVDLARIAGAVSEETQDALRYFLNDAVSADQCGDHPAPCNHDPAHPKDSE